ncbi:hypothetical protein D3C76_886490 [compost metagenome]
MSHYVFSKLGGAVQIAADIVVRLEFQQEIIVEGVIALGAGQSLNVESCSEAIELQRVSLFGFIYDSVRRPLFGSDHGIQ